MGEEPGLLDRVLGDKVICDVIHMKSIHGGIVVWRNEKDCSQRRIVHRTGLSILAPPDSFSDGLWGECVFSVCDMWHFRD